MLNCTCFSKTNGQWIGPYKKSIHSNDSYVILYALGMELNSKLNTSKYRVLDGYDQQKCDLQISNFLSDDDGRYGCYYTDSETSVVYVYNIVAASKYRTILTVHEHKT